MKTTFIIFLYVLILIGVSSTKDIASSDVTYYEKFPTILIATLIRNKEHTLPYFLTYLQNLSYPKNRIALWFRSDHNEDKSIELLEVWLKKNRAQYHNVDFAFDNTLKRYENDESPTVWTSSRFNKVIKLKEQALQKANELWADYIFFLDADAFITYPETLSHLVSLGLPIVAPMLKSGTTYSNFWCGMDESYYYQRTDDYRKIYKYKKTGNFPVPMVHGAVLIHLNHPKSDFLTFDRKNLIWKQTNKLLDPKCKLFDGPLDDIVIFAISANCSGIPMYISNEKAYGYILQPLDESDSIDSDKVQLTHTKLNIIVDHPDSDVQVDEVFRKYIQYPKKQKLTLDHIYMINLDRRSERLRKRNNSFRELGLDVERFPAVDGKKLNSALIKELGIEILKGYEDPFAHRPIKMGEIGCFLSHYRIWEKIVENNQKEVLILEDDVRFSSNFNDEAISVLEQARSTGEFDLLYFGRKRLTQENESYVEKTKNLVHVSYSYWAVGYVITLEGAKKLIAGEPLKKLIPVDEYLPLMFNRHPNDTWASAFPQRNLKAYSAKPLLLFPSHYTGESGHISDTEDSEITPQGFSDEGSDQMKELDSEPKFSFESKEILEDGLNRIVSEIGNSITKHDLSEL